LDPGPFFPSERLIDSAGVMRGIFSGIAASDREQVSCHATACVSIVGVIDAFSDEKSANDGGRVRSMTAAFDAVMCAKRSAVVGAWGKAGAQVLCFSRADTLPPFCHEPAKRKAADGSLSFLPYNFSIATYASSTASFL
jgi:hypothetical protein